MTETLWQDLRYGARMLAKSPGFTAVAVLTLALGIGANTAIFSAIYGVLLRPLPYPHPDQIVQLWEVAEKGNRMNFTDPNFEDLRAASHSLEGLAQYASGVYSISGGSEPTRTVGAVVSRDFFTVMGVQPLIGRGFTAEEQRAGAAPVILVSYAYWQQFLGSSKDLSQLKLAAENQVFTVVGVMPPGFHFPQDTELWVTRQLYPRLPSRTAHNWHVIGRLRGGVPLAQARAEISGIAARLKRQYGTDIDMSDAAALPLQDAMTGHIRPALLLLLGAVGFLLLVACANVANLLLSQAAARERELAIRAALGAERGRLVRQFLTETLLLSLLGGVLGVLTALWGVDALVSLAPRDLPRLNEISVNLPVLLFALAISVLVAAGLGVFTAARATSGDLRGALSEGGRGQAGALHSQRLGRAIVAAQLAITLVLLVGAGLLGRSLLRVLSIDPGFRTENVVTMALSLPLSLPSADEGPAKVRRVNFLNTLFSRLRAIPGVEAVGGSNALPPPLGDNLADGTFLTITAQQVPKRMEDFEQLLHNTSATGEADYCVASEDYFRVLGIPLLRGRLFGDHDVMDAPHVAVINQALARAKWPNEDPNGKTIEFGNMDGDLRLLTIVGVVGDVRNRSLEAPPRPTVYVNFRQRPQATASLTVFMRTSAPPASVLPAARSILRDLAPDVPPRFATFSQVMATALGTRRFNLTLIGVFAATALLLAMAGIYGVMAYSVARRTREIGVRMALGAAPANVLRMVLGQGMRTAAAGVAIGIAGSLALTRTMESLLFGVRPTDPPTFAGVALLLGLVALVACWIPARRATKVDPMVALRHE